MMWLKDIIVPEKINSYYLLPQRVVGFDINKTSVQATKIVYSGSKKIIEQLIHQPLEHDTKKSLNERIINGIKIVARQLGTVDQIRTALPSSQVIFKELTLPFNDPEKVAKVLPFELEPYLPFSLQQAVVDFIIVDAQSEKITVLAAAVKKEYITEHLSLFAQAGLNPTTITVDIFDLYGLYKSIPLYAARKDTVALIDIEAAATRIAYIVDGTLTAVRTVTKGTSHWVKDLAQQLDISPAQAHEKLIRFGLGAHTDEHYTKAIQQSLQPFLQEIQFTLQSFATRSTTPVSTDQILLLGSGSEIAGMTQFMQEAIGIETTLFDVNALVTHELINLKHGSSIPRTNILSVGTAFISPTTAAFNLRKNEFAVGREGLFEKQFFVAIGLLLTLLTILFLHSYFEINKLSKAKASSSRQVVKSLQAHDLTDEKNLKNAIQEAEERVANQEAIWFAFSSQTRFSFLKYLQDLSAAIDRIGIGLKLEKLLISQKDNTITLEGSVRDFDALKVLERELKESNLFMYVPSLQDTRFNITIPLKQHGEE